MLPPMGLVFGLIVGFLVAGLWGDVIQARAAVKREASSLRSVVLVPGAAFPGRLSARMDALVRQHIHDAAVAEWPAIASQHATLTVVPAPLAAALSLALRLKARSQGQATAQRELDALLDDAVDARRQRIIVSRSTINWVKWTSVIALAVLTLTAIAFVHSDNRKTAAIAMGLFASAVAVTLVMIASQDRPASASSASRRTCSSRCCRRHAEGPCPVSGSQGPELGAGRRPRRRRRSMKQSRTVLAGLAVALGACGALVAPAQTAPPTSTAQPERIDLATGLPRFAPGYRLSLTRAVIPPGAAFPPHRHPGMQVAFIEAGTLRFTVFRGSVKVFRGPADGSQKLVRTITPGHPGSIATGEWIVETPNLRHQGANTGRARVVILLATLLRANQPAAIPVTP
jgi:hypothetical protein